MVDLFSNTTLGECSCRDYVCRSLPLFKKTGQRRFCKHIKVARELFIDDVIKHLMGKNQTT